MIELSFEKHPRLKERNEIFVGRNDLIESIWKKEWMILKKVNQCVWLLLVCQKCWKKNAVKALHL
ncbi:MAG: hypothetical protein ACLTLY_08505 [Agathobacter rectalis]